MGKPLHYAKGVSRRAKNIWRLKVLGTKESYSNNYLPSQAHKGLENVPRA